MSTLPSAAVRKSLKAPIRVIYSRDDIAAPLPDRVKDYPEFRYMGSKNRLLPWIHSVLNTLDFETAADPFAGSGCVAYLLKGMGKRVIASDFLNFSATIARATIGNSHHQLDGPALEDPRTRQECSQLH